MSSSSSPPSSEQKDSRTKPQRVAVFGGGTFGTALATLFARNGHEVTVLVRREARMEGINGRHRNPHYLAEYELSTSIRATMSAEEALRGATLVVHAIPVQASLGYFRAVRQYLAPDVPVLSLSKGIHCDTLQFMVDLIHEGLSPEQPCAFFSGPTFARELMDDEPSGAVVASSDPALAERVQLMLASPRMRVYTTDDVLGVEVGGALKNIYAIGAGISEGLGHSSNAAALLVTRGCAEMRRLAVKLGARPETLAGLSGMGDLMLTCFGGKSRNKSVGVRLGRGESIEDIIASMPEVAEGVPTTEAAVKLARREGVKMPMAEGLYAVLKGREKPVDALNRLMTLRLHDEHDDSAHD